MHIGDWFSASSQNAHIVIASCLPLQTWRLLVPTFQRQTVTTAPVSYVLRTDHNRGNCSASYSRHAACLIIAATSWKTSRSRIGTSYRLCTANFRPFTKKQSSKFPSGHACDCCKPSKHFSSVLVGLSAPSDGTDLKKHLNSSTQPSSPYL